MAAVLTHRQAPYVTAEAVVKQLATLDWDFDGVDTLGGGHGLHPYPAKFPPQVPRQVIGHLTEPGDLVVDPFGGSGTTALEAVQATRRCLSIDANPVAVRLTRAKVTGLESGARESLRALLVQARSSERRPCTAGDTTCAALGVAPKIANMWRWFAPSSVHELCHLRLLVDELEGVARDVAELAIGQVAARVSFQESETRYVSRPRAVASGEALERFVGELERLISLLPVAAANAARGATVVQGDARDRGTWHLEPESAALVVTSPPYPNAYDYHLYHRFRLAWTRAEPAELRRVEIGSHLRQQSLADPIGDYESDMRAVITNSWAALRPGGWLVLVVGDGKYKGEIYSTSEAMEGLGRAIGFEAGGAVTRGLPKNRRSVTVAGRRLEQEQLVFLRKPGAAVAAGPAWPMVDYEESLAARELAVLAGRGSRALTDLTFARAVCVDGTVHTTTQGLLEAADGTRRKNSTYATHGIHRYKGKFYPQLGRCLINLSCEPNALVVDPFTGSGTVGLEAALLGRRFHGIELSPVGAATARAKIGLMSVPANVIDTATGTFIGMDSPTSRVGRVPWEEFDGPTHDELESWFAPTVLARLGVVLKAIREVEQVHAGWDAVGEAARVCLSDLVREVSHQDPSDLRIRRRKEPLVDAPVEAMFVERWTEVVRKVFAAKTVVGDLAPNARIVEGDSTDPGNWPTNSDGSPAVIDAVVSSPPYAAALPYLDTDRLSLAAVFANNKRMRTSLESQLVGSREITTRDLRQWDDWLRTGDLAEYLPASTSTFLLALSDAVSSDPSAGFRRQQTPAVLARYFVAMSKVLGHITDRLRPGGQVWYVLGDSRTTISGEHWRIPTTQETAAIAKHHGLQLVEAIPISVTRENMRHAKNAITSNTLLHFQAR